MVLPLAAACGVPGAAVGALIGVPSALVCGDVISVLVAASAGSVGA